MGRDTGHIAAAVQRAGRQRAAAAAAVGTAARRVRTTRRRVAAAREAQVLLQGVAQQVQQEAHRQVAEVVSMCLGTVFPDPYRLHIEFVQRRGRTEADITFQRGAFSAPPLEAAGGGAADVAAFALRLASLALRRPPARRLLVLDEPFKHLSRQYRPAVRQLLEQLAEDMGFQIIMVTHDTELCTGTVVQLGQQVTAGQPD